MAPVDSEKRVPLPCKLVCQKRSLSSKPVLSLRPGSTELSRVPGLDGRSLPEAAQILRVLATVLRSIA